MAETLTVRLFGDTVKSEQLRLAHVNRLVSDLVSSMENSGLEIDQRFMRFTDGSEIMIKRVFGATTVHIMANAPKPKKEQIVLPNKQRIVPHERISIVPAIEAYDYDGNFKGLVICTSGTFEPPYYFVPIKEDYLNDFFDEWSATILDGAAPMKPKGFTTNWGTQIEKNFTVIPQTSEIRINSRTDTETFSRSGEWTGPTEIVGNTAPYLFSGNPLDGLYATWVRAARPFSQTGELPEYTINLKQLDSGGTPVGDPISGYLSVRTGTYTATGYASNQTAWGGNNFPVDSQADLDDLTALYNQYLDPTEHTYLDDPFDDHPWFYIIGATASETYPAKEFVYAPDYYIGAKDRTHWGGFLRYRTLAQYRACDWSYSSASLALDPVRAYTLTEWPNDAYVDDGYASYEDTESYRFAIVVDGEEFPLESGSGSYASAPYTVGRIGYYRVGSKSYFLCARFESYPGGNMKYSATRPFKSTDRFVETAFTADATKTWLHAIGETGYYGKGFFRLVQIREPMEPDIIQE